jgi:potassium-dependent mechanosensitive channel
MHSNRLLARGIGLRLIFVLLLLSASAGTRADTIADAPVLADIEKRLAALRQGPADDPQNARLIELYQNSAEHLRSAAEHKESRARFERLQQEARGKIERYTTQLLDLQRQVRSAQSLSQGVAVERLERLLRDTRSQLLELRSSEAALQSTTNSLQQRTESARQELQALNMAQSGESLGPPAGGAESGEIAQARIDEWNTRRVLNAAHQARLEAEVRTIPERLLAVQAQLKLVTAQAAQTERFLNELLGMENLRRIGEAERQREQLIERIAADVSTQPELVALRSETLQLADELIDIVGRSESIAADLRDASAMLEELRGSFNGIRAQLEIAALGESLGPVLMEHYQKLGSFDRPETKLRAIGSTLSETRLREFQVARLLSDDTQLRERIYLALETGADLSAAERAATVAEADRILNDRSTLLESLSRAYSETTAQIVDLDQAYRAQADVAGNFRALLDRNLVWMKSHRPLQFMDLVRWPVASANLLIGQEWGRFGQALMRGLLDHPVSALLALLPLVLLARYGKQLKLYRDSISLRNVGWQQYRSRMAFEALGLQMLLVLPLPLLLMWAGWLMSTLDQEMPLARAFSSALLQLSLAAYLFLFILRALGPDGFARQHLRWRAARVRAVEAHLRTALWLLLPLGGLSLVIGVLVQDAALDYAFRVTSILHSLGFLVFAVLIARAGRGMFESAFYSKSYPILASVGSALVLAVIIAEPLVVLLDVRGYHFTARELQHNVFVSVAVLVIAKMINDSGLLLLSIASQRSLAVQQSAGEEEQERERAVIAEDGVQLRVAEAGDEIDLRAMSASAIAMLQTFVAGLAAVTLVLIWQQFFAALTRLEEVVLWNYATTIDGADALAAVSLFDFGSTLLLLVFTLVLAKGLPALLGIVLYSLVTEKGMLYTIQTLVRYTVIVFGFMLVLQNLGFGWSKLQWMAAGLSVGLGFGLQEIFANFISGLIMLFERPVRIGDVITLGEFSGTIQRIRMRATTITDFDNREIIVPNKMFVTERLINWTLSSSVVRLSFDVGISYDADPRVARDTLLEILNAEPRVRAEPAPAVVFREFGASSLNLRCFAHVDDVSLRFPVQNDLHMRISEVFRERGIEIAYPQMDLHLRSVDPVAGRNLAEPAPAPGSAQP